jgi:hypothetical protein
MHISLASAALAALLAAAGTAAAQGTAAPAKAEGATSRPAAKPAARPALARSAQKAVEEATPVDDDPNVTISEADLLVARQVHVGDIPCELGASVRVRAARREGLFVVTTKGYRFLMHPVESRTGAIRLEDPKRGAMWLQLGNKSMLMSQKLGQRLADECQSPQQLTVADDLKRNPRPSILDAPVPPAASTAPAAAAAVPAAPAAPEPTPAVPAAPGAPVAPVPAPAPAAPAAPVLSPAVAPASAPAAVVPAALAPAAPAAPSPKN